ncbi:unnamed protein product, partial [Staurois parvus]
PSCSPLCIGGHSFPVVYLYRRLFLPVVSIVSGGHSIHVCAICIVAFDILSCKSLLYRCTFFPVVSL